MRHLLLLLLTLLFAFPVTAQTTQKKVAVILYNFENYNLQTTTADSARSDVFTRTGPFQTGSVNAYYKENSYGHLELVGALRSDGDVFGVYTIPNSVLQYSQQDYSGTLLWPCGSVGVGAAEQMAQSDGFVKDNYDIIIYVFPSSICNYSAITQGHQIYINSSNGIPNYLLAHEVGHVFGLQHAHALLCTDSTGALTTIGNSCTEYNRGYGDFFDVMATGGLHHMNAYEKEQQNSGTAWFNPNNLQVVSSSGSYTITPFELADNEVKYLKIRRYDGSYWYLEFRQNYGFDIWAADHPVLQGALIHLAPDPFSTSGLASALIDTTPNSTLAGLYPFEDAALAVGKTFTDSAYGISFTTLNVSSAGATVQVNFDPSACKPTPASLTVSPLTEQGAPGTALTYKLSLRNDNITACSGSTYTININAPAKWSVSPNSFSESLMPGEGVTRDVFVTPPAGTRSGSYMVSQKAVNSSKKTLASSAQMTVTIH